MTLVFLGFGETGFGELGFGEMGFGEMGHNLCITSINVREIDVHVFAVVYVSIQSRK